MKQFRAKVSISTKLLLTLALQPKQNRFTLHFRPKTRPCWKCINNCPACQMSVSRFSVHSHPWCFLLIILWSSLSFYAKLLVTCGNAADNMLGTGTRARCRTTEIVPYMLAQMTHRSERMPHTTLVDMFVQMSVSTHHAYPRACQYTKQL